MLNVDESRVACPTFDSNQFAANYPNVPNFVSHHARTARGGRAMGADAGRVAEYFSELARAMARAGPTPSR